MSTYGANNLIVKDSFLAVVDGRLISIINGRKDDSGEIPLSGKRIYLPPSVPGRPYKSMCVGDRGKIADYVQPFDTLYYEWGYFIKIVQVMPTEDPKFGILQYRDTQPLHKDNLGQYHDNSDRLTKARRSS